MISDYLDYDMNSQEQDGQQAAYDMWGTVLPDSDDTEAGNVRVKVRLMKDKMDTFDNVPVLTGYGGRDHGVFFLPEEDRKSVV